MKKVLLLCLPVLLFACSSSRRATSQPQFADNPVVAHRGAFKKLGLPENSIASLRQAIALQCTGSEFDVRMTADDSLVINHDPAYHSLPIETTRYDSLLRFPLSNGEPLPTLRQYLLAGLQGNKHTRLVCEIKPSPAGKERAAQIAMRVLQLVRELKAAPMTVYISFDHHILTTLLRADPSLNTQYLNGDLPPEQLKADGIKGADYNFSVFKAHPEWIASAKNMGIVLNAWTVNDAAGMDLLLDNGFQFITTNEPELLLEKWKKNR